MLSLIAIALLGNNCDVVIRNTLNCDNGNCQITIDETTKIKISKGSHLFKANNVERKDRCNNWWKITCQSAECSYEVNGVVTKVIEGQIVEGLNALPPVPQDGTWVTRKRAEAMVDEVKALKETEKQVEQKAKASDSIVSIFFLCIIGSLFVVTAIRGLAHHAAVVSVKHHLGEASKKRERRRQVKAWTKGWSKKHLRWWL